MELVAQPSQSQMSGKEKKKPPLTSQQHTSPFEMGYACAGSVGAPLFELQSVEISGPFFNQVVVDSDVVEVHGQIILTDDLGNEFSLFSLNRSDRLLFNLHKSSSVLNIGRDKLGDARCLPSVLLLDFQLILGWQPGVEMQLNEQMIIDCTSNVTYDKLQQSSISIPFPKSALHICVNYMNFKCAALARPGFVVRKRTQDTDDDDDDSVVELSGSIDVCYQMSDLSWMTLRLFDQEAAQSKLRLFGQEAQNKVELGEFIEGPTIAYPAYSTLFFELDVHVNGEHFVYARDALTFDFSLHYGISFHRQVHGEKYSISLIMYHSIVIKELPENIIRERCDAETMKLPYKKRLRSCQVNDQVSC